MSINELIQRYSLESHPEGGFYRQVFCAAETVTLARGERSAMTAIYFLLSAENFSAWHQLQSDEVWAYLEGSADCCIHMIDEQGNYSKQSLGAKSDAAVPLFVVPARTWFAVEIQASAQRGERSDADYALCSCIVAPGFHWQDFKLPSRQELLPLFPQHAALIEKFTRVSDPA